MHLCLNAHMFIWIVCLCSFVINANLCICVPFYAFACLSICPDICPQTRNRLLVCADYLMLLLRSSLDGMPRLVIIVRIKINEATTALFFRRLQSALTQQLWSARVLWTCAYVFCKPLYACVLALYTCACVLMRLCARMPGCLDVRVLVNLLACVLGYLLLLVCVCVPVYA